MVLPEQADSRPDGEQKLTTPSISLPRGGGAIRGIGEKFAANPVTGTGTLSVPLAMSPGRSGFGPQLALSYDSGSGNGPFGFGWSLALPAISRKTDKGLPRYKDLAESDTFILSGAEDLVPILVSRSGNWVPQSVPDRTVGPVTYRIRRYRPRVEGLFARIERWTNISDAKDVHWRSISNDNVLTLYGKDAKSRIADAEDPSRIFTWLICETRDDKGNAVLYEYKPEDGNNIDLTQAHERNRGGRDDSRRMTNRYPKYIRYGNRAPLLNNTGQRPLFLTDTQIRNAGWMFEAVFDYGEHGVGSPKPDDAGQWISRADPFSSYRAGFEVRTCRLCRRVLMFHHFPNEAGVGTGCLVRSTDFSYSHEQDPEHVRNPVYTFLQRVTQSGYKRDNGGYLKRGLPPVEFEYSQPIVQDTVNEVDSARLRNLPMGLEGTAYQWADLHGEGIPGILTEQADAWFYMRNLSPINDKSGTGAVQIEPKFAPVELVAARPNLPLASGAIFMDLAGDGQPDLVALDGPAPGLYEHDCAEGWQSFRPFTDRLNRDVRDPNLRFVDLTGDGHADILITEDDAFIWHASLAEEGFGPAQRVRQVLDEEKGARLIFADETQSIYLADLSGDGLMDLMRIRNGEVCYWPGLGYARFGAKVTMDRPPQFDHPGHFDHKRIRLADIDGTGTTDIIYLHRGGIRLYFNESGNSWSAPEVLRAFPPVDNLVTVMPLDLLGNGTACLVWSSRHAGDAQRCMRYINLMGAGAQQKPHLLVKIVNNLGAETRIRYAPSVKFYLQDKRDGRPWITRLPFPVYVVERVETLDKISRNHFVTRFAYHHGYFDSEEREFHGFGMVERWDTEAFAALADSGAVPSSDDIGAASQVPPIRTKTWFHTGVYLDRDDISRQFEEDYYREPGLDDRQVQAQLLANTPMPVGLTPEEKHEACRALKGTMLRQEVYADDAPPGASKAVIRRAGTPYTVVEQNFTVQCLQPRTSNRHAVFFTHSREAITYHYERNPADPRVQHAITLEVDPYGNVLKEAAIAYGRRQPDLSLPVQADRDKQMHTFVTFTENRFTVAVDDSVARPDHYRAPLPCETRTFELTGYTPTGAVGRFQVGDLVQAADNHLIHVFDTEIDYEDVASGGRQRRLIEHMRTLYRPDDLGAARNDPMTLLPLGELEPLALSGESYQLAFTLGLAQQIYVDSGKLTTDELDAILANEGRYVHVEGDANWWIPSGRTFLSQASTDTAADELANARQHFFLPRRIRDPFHNDAARTESIVTYDAYDLLILESRDALGNRITVGERLPNGDLDFTKPGNDYRVLQPWRLMDPNRNRTQVAFDIHGMVVGTAVMGKPEESLGDSLVDFTVDLPEAVTVEHLANPLVDPHVILGTASTRIVYDLFAYARTKDQPDPQPAVVHTLARETHDADLLPGEQTKIQHSFSYSDGFGREIQSKIQAEPEKVNGGTGPSRWVGSGWTVFNNKGKPVRQYEPFFSDLPEGDDHRFEFGVEVGVSPILFYDPVERVAATLHPNHTYEKGDFDPWQQTTWDVNDTVLGDPRTDSDIAGYTARYFASEPTSPAVPPWQSWYAQRRGGALGAAEQAAAAKAAAHVNTPTVAILDALGRPFLTIVDKGPASTDKHATRVELDIEGNQRVARDAIEQQGDVQGRIVMRSAYDLLGHRIHDLSMEAGARWMLNDVTGQPIRAWDSRGHSFRNEYDPLRRPLRSFVTGADPGNPDQERLTERLIYGEQHSEAELRNLRGALYLHLDQAGAVITEGHDFKGNPQRASRRIALEYKRGPDWQGVDASLPADATALLNAITLEAAIAPMMEADHYVSHTTYDALNRAVALTTPHTPVMPASVIRPGYNEANRLERMDVNLRGATAAGQPVWTPFISNIDYDARGQRQRIDYANGVSTFYNYDPLTFRLVHLLTRRNAVALPDNCPQRSPPGSSGRELQNLHYTYDPVGNITRIRDAAQQTLYFRNRRVEPNSDYSYDALYRLIEATGREHLGQSGGAPIPHSHNDAIRIGIDWSASDGNAMGTYVERYVYDAVGNILEMQHRGGDQAHPGWTRSYAYNEASLIEDGTGGTLHKTSDRLSSTTVGNGNPIKDRYVYDAHGNTTRMPHLGGTHPTKNMHWDYGDRLRQIDLGGGGTAYYTYDAAGERVRKVWEKSANLVEERLYLGGFEIYRRRQGAAQLERETLHIMDDQLRIALVETRTLDTAGSDRAPQQLIRTQISNHLGSASLELDDQARIISYEEYTPYGSTSYQAVRSRTETPKRYCYTGKERDEESGSYYYGARYYLPWLGRWASADPAGLVDGPNLYRYAHNNPVLLNDPSGTDPPDPGGYLSYEDFANAAPMYYRDDYLRSIWDAAHPASSPNDIIHSIAEIEKPGDVAQFWADEARPNRNAWAHSLSELETGYIQALRDPSVPAALRMRAPVDPQNLTSEERTAAARLFGTDADRVQQYANYENRRRVMAHYVLTHPATVRLQLGLFRLVRDINPIHFALERGWQIGSGREMFTQQQVSRLGAAAEFFASLALIYGVGRGLNAARPSPQFQGPVGPTRSLTDPIYDLPAGGGGMRVNGRWYTEHALERMAPNTPQVRAEIGTRVRARLARAGFQPGHPAYDRVYAKAMQRIDPRGVPPSVVEAEIAAPGSTNVRVITASRGRTVVTVIRR